MFLHHQKTIFTFSSNSPPHTHTHLVIVVVFAKLVISTDFRMRNVMFDQFYTIYTIYSGGPVSIPKPNQTREKNKME